MRERYNEAFELIIDCLDSDRQSEAHQALNSSMNLLTNEGFYPLEDPLNNQPFPILQLNKIISKLLLTDRLMKNIIVRLSDYAIYEDFCFYVWKLIMKNLIPANKSDLNHIFIQNFLELLNVIIPTPPTANENKELEEEGSRFMCKSSKLDPSALKRNVNKVWNVVVQWPHNDLTQKQLLVLLLEKVLVYLDKPMMLTDYLMDSLDVGGQISLLALQGIFILIHKHNISYPNIYEKLYMMFEPEIFHMKFKPRLFHLADIFLTSSYLPETLVAAFVKRLARLALIAPPQDIIIIVYFIGNLIIRHPGLKRLICDRNSTETREVSHDPFMMDEADPNKSQALQSSLWEIQLLRNHILPSVAQAAKNIMTQPLPGQEWNLGNFLELKENDVSLVWSANCFHSLTFDFLSSALRSRNFEKVPRICVDVQPPNGVEIATTNGTLKVLEILMQTFFFVVESKIIMK